LSGLPHQEVGADVAFDVDCFVSGLPFPQADVEVVCGNPTGGRLLQPFQDFFGDFTVSHEGAVG
jgi:hypothetical protein